MTASTPVAGIILAAGRSTRFGANKLLADLHGRPVLQHVLDLVATAQLAPVVVVLGPESDVLVAACAWRSEARVVNPEPERGISSLLVGGLTALERTDAERVLVLLGDQPLVTAEQLHAILTAAPDPKRPILVPRYALGGNRNPVRLDRQAWALARELRGDRGMAQVIAARPELIRYVDVPGANPDVDTAADLAALI